MDYDTIILGAGAAGLMCAAHCGGRTLILDHARNPGEKIRISGGGRCNFTNMHCTPENFVSANPHFVKSALARYSQWDFLDLVQSHGIAWHEKTLGQLFCDESAKQIIAMLLELLTKSGAELNLQTSVTDFANTADGYQLTLQNDQTQRVVSARNLVIATGGKSIPKMGATGFAYDLARRFDIPLIDTRPGLVPLTFPPERFAGLSGVSLPVNVTANSTTFAESLLFTHRGLSGPAILQASSYWTQGDSIEIDLTPGQDPVNHLKSARKTNPKRDLKTELGHMIPAKLADYLAAEWHLTGNLADQSDKAFEMLARRLHHWQITPAGSEGYRTAEVTLGGISTDALSSRTMETKTRPGLYFIGECVDVTGHLGGHNFQWAWSSAMAAAAAISA